MTNILAPLRASDVFKVTETSKNGFLHEFFVSGSALEFFVRHAEQTACELEIQWIPIISMDKSHLLNFAWFHKFDSSLNLERKLGLEVDL